jgi:hypothetical protein
MGNQNQFPARPSDSNVQPPVVEDKARSTGTDKGQDHDVALATLKPLDRIDDDACS